MTADILSEKEFYDFVLNKYEPSEFETGELTDSRFYEGTNFSHICKTRCFLIYREMAERLKGCGKVIDFGFFPGTVLRQLKMLLNTKMNLNQHKIQKEPYPRHYPESRLPVVLKMWL